MSPWRQVHFKACKQKRFAEKPSFSFHGLKELETPEFFIVLDDSVLQAPGSQPSQGAPKHGLPLNSALIQMCLISLRPA